MASNHSVVDIKWKQINQLKFTDEFYKQAVEYLKEDKIPDDVKGDAQKKFKFRRKLKAFQLNDQDELLLVIENDKHIPWNKDKDKKKLFDVPLPYTMKVIK